MSNTLLFFYESCALAGDARYAGLTVKPGQVIVVVMRGKCPAQQFRVPERPMASGTYLGVEHLCAASPDRPGKQDAAVALSAANHL